MKPQQQQGYLYIFTIVVLLLIIVFLMHNKTSLQPPQPQLPLSPQMPGQPMQPMPMQPPFFGVYGQNANFRNGFPVNASTNIGFVNSDFSQVGILNSIVNKGETPATALATKKILPLFGRPVFTNRNKWNYFTSSDQFNTIKLPILKKKQNCNSSTGCDELYNNDIVFVQGYNQPFRVTMYDNDSAINYIPYL
jgi:hypothetical protein